MNCEEKFQHFVAVTSALRILFLLHVIFHVYVQWSSSDMHPVFQTRFSPSYWVVIDVCNFRLSPVPNFHLYVPLFHYAVIGVLLFFLNDFTQKNSIFTYVLLCSYLGVVGVFFSSILHELHTNSHQLKRRGDSREFLSLIGVLATDRCSLTSVKLLSNETL